MALKILQGSVKTDFLKILVQKIQNISSDEEIFLIVPNNLKFKTEIKVISMLKGNKDESFFSVPNLKIYSFNRLVWYFLNDSSYFQLPEITTSMKNMLLTSILIAKNDELKVYKNFANDAGFIDLLCKQIEIFEQEKIETDQILHLEANCFDRDKNSDIALIYQTYESLISQPFRTDCSDFKALSQYLATVNLKNSNFIFFDYLEMTRVEIDLFKQLINQAKNVYYLRYHDEIIKNDPILDELKRSSIKPEYINYHSVSSDVAAVFDHNLKPENKQSIQIFRCADRFAEVKKVALEITHLVRKKGARYNDFLIVGSQINEYDPIFKEVFHDYQIPYFGEFTNAMAQAPVTYLLKKILDLVRGQIKLNDIFDLLKTQLVFNQENLSLEDIFAAENVALQLGISGSDFLSLTLENEKLKNSFVKKEDQLESFLLVKKNVQETFIPLISALKKGKKVIDYVNIIYDFFEQRGIFYNLNQKRLFFEKEGNQLASDQIEQEVNNFVKLLDEIVVVFKEQDLSIHDFSQVLLNGFKTKTFAMVPAVIDAVQISDVNKVNLPVYKYIWIINAVDGNLPFIHDPNELLLSNEELEAMAFETGNQFLLRYGVKWQNQAERNLNYLMMSSAKYQLYMSFARQAQDTKLLPSMYITDLHEKLGIPIHDFVDRPTPDSFTRRLRLPNPALTDLVQVLRQSLISKEPLTDEWSSLFQWFQNKRPLELEQVLKSLTINDDHKIDSNIIGEIFEEQLLLSITNMETYFRNPYEFFIKYVLKVKERSISEVNPLVSGLVFHEVLDRFFKLLKSRNQTIFSLSEKELIQITNDIYQSVVENQHLGFLLNDPIDHFNIDLLKQTVIQTLRSIKIQGLSSNTIFTEKTFGTDGDLIQPIYDLAANRHLKLIGKIDRLDVLTSGGEQFFNVIDYKSSNRKFDLNDFYTGLDLQLITYLQILKKYYFKKSNQKIGGSFFYQIQDPTIEYEKIKTNFEQSWLKGYQYNGLFINDKAYLDIISKDLAVNGLKWNDLFPIVKSKNQKNAYSLDEFEIIFNYNDNRFKKIANMIYQGQFPQKLLFKTFDDIVKYRDNVYQSILLFDPEINKDFRVWQAKTPDELLRQMGGLGSE